MAHLAARCLWPDESHPVPADYRGHQRPGGVGSLVGDYDGTHPGQAIPWRMGTLGATDPGKRGTVGKWVHGHYLSRGHSGRHRSSSQEDNYGPERPDLRWTTEGHSVSGIPSMSGRGNVTHICLISAFARKLYSDCLWRKTN